MLETKTVVVSLAVEKVSLSVLPSVYGLSPSSPHSLLHLFGDH